jgi:hypothetical protein
LGESKENQELSIGRRMRKLARLFRMTMANRTYDEDAGFEREFEIHFKVARRGSPKTVRRTLVLRGIPHFQREIYRRYNIRIPRSRIRVSFEREEVAAAGQRAIEALGRSMRYHGRQWSATPLPPKMIPYAKKTRRGAKRKHVSKKHA